MNLDLNVTVSPYFDFAGSNHWGCRIVNRTSAEGVVTGASSRQMTRLLPI
jgi:hypothetical protein